MKMNFVFVFLFFVSWANAQSFEGSIRYKLNLAERTEQLGFQPAFNEYLIKGDHLMVNILDKENIVITRILLSASDKAIYILDDVEKIAMKMALSQEAEEVIGNVPEMYQEEYRKALEKTVKENERPQLHMVNTGEKANIAGYDCEKYEVEEGNGKGMNSFVWLTERIKFDIPVTLTSQQNELFGFISEKGFPLKIEGPVDPDNPTSSIGMVAVKIKQEKLDMNLFIVPADYKVSDLSALMR